MTTTTITVTQLHYTGLSMTRPRKERFFACGPYQISSRFIPRGGQHFLELQWNGSQLVVKVDGALEFETKDTKVTTIAPAARRKKAP